MKYRHLTVLLIAISFASCKKNVETIYQQQPEPFVPTLKVEKVINDSTIVLKWNKYTGNNFRSYKLFKNYGNFQNPQVELGEFANADSVTYTESAVPLSPKVNYTIEIKTDSFFYYSSVEYTRSDFFFGGVTDVLINENAHLLYLLSAFEKKISLIDYSNNTKLFEKSFDVEFGASDLGDFNGTKNELYLPKSDGWLDILDASNLELKDRIYVHGTNVGSVVSHQGKLFVSSSDISVPHGLDDNALKIYTRSDKNLIARTGLNQNTKLLMLQGSNTELVDLTLNIIPTDLCYYSFDANGKPLTEKKDTYHGDYLMTPQIFRSFPKGDYFITSDEGNIFDKNLIYKNSLPESYRHNYSDFAFNEAGNIIYASNSSSKSIVAISYPQLQPLKTYTTKFYPFKIFRSGDTLICICSTEQYNVNPFNQFAYFFIEKIKI